MCVDFTQINDLDYSVLQDDDNNDDSGENDYDDIINKNDNNMIYNNDDNSAIFEVNMLDNVTIKCPVKGCSYFTRNMTNLQKHFRSRHPDAIIIIEQEGLLPQWHECGIFQQNVNTSHHLHSEDCKKYAGIKRN